MSDFAKCQTSFYTKICTRIHTIIVSYVTQLGLYVEWWYCFDDIHNIIVVEWIIYTWFLYVVFFIVEASKNQSSIICDMHLVHSSFLFVQPNPHSTRTKYQGNTTIIPQPPLEDCSLNQIEYWHEKNTTIRTSATE